jgi:hypothetical protein
LVNAVIDALRPLGVEFVNMPLTPEAIRAALRADSSRGVREARGARRS